MVYYSHRHYKKKVKTITTLNISQRINETTQTMKGIYFTYRKGPIIPLILYWMLWCHIGLPDCVFCNCNIIIITIIIRIIRQFMIFFISGPICVTLLWLFSSISMSISSGTWLQDVSDAVYFSLLEGCCINFTWQRENWWIKNWKSMAFVPIVMKGKKFLIQLYTTINANGIQKITMTSKLILWLSVSKHSTFVQHLLHCQVDCAVFPFAFLNAS